MNRSELAKATYEELPTYKDCDLFLNLNPLLIYYTKTGPFGTFLGPCADFKNEALPNDKTKF